MGLADGSIHSSSAPTRSSSEAVGYKTSASAVVDEQHRFGVSQRMMLSQKAERPPHLLAMTATPIPRTLTLAQYGEMDVSRLDEMPPGRQPIDTPRDQRRPAGRVVDGLARHSPAASQAYWVCPMVEESETERPRRRRRRAPPEGCASATPSASSTAGSSRTRMRRWTRSRAASQLLVATTVIEVGVDVPNATLMIVEQAERFGLAQLHQLRGGSGRGERAQHLPAAARQYAQRDRPRPPRADARDQ